MPDQVSVVHVVVPAHDEALLLPACLGALRTALDVVRQTRPQVTARLTVVLDACRDASAEVCAERGVDVVVTDGADVGLARAAGTRRAADLAASDGVVPGHTWVACTDADSLVPPTWLVDQVEVAEQGADVVLGRVEPDPTAPAEVVAGWHALHDDGRVGVHGAHLGLRLSSYDSVGGFAAMPTREDLDLVRRLLDAGARYGEARVPVLTSSRLEGRAAGGFADFLAVLAAGRAGRAGGAGQSGSVAAADWTSPREEVPGAPSSSSERRSASATEVKR